MTERPILMSAPMVRAILAGTKTVTRRIVKPQPREVFGHGVPLEHVDRQRRFGVHARLAGDLASTWVPCIYGAPGDRLWVRETWRVFGGGEYEYQHDPSQVIYRADPEASNGGEWRPSIFMPRWASRLTLEVVSVKVERLHEITDDDSRREGVVSGRIPADDYGPERIGYVLGRDDGRCILYPTERDAFQMGWQVINGAESWAANPWVWRVEFRRVENR